MDIFKKRLSVRAAAACAHLAAAAGFLIFLRAAALSVEPERPAVRLGYFIGGRTNLFGRAFAYDYFEREGVRVELTTRRLRGPLMKVPKGLEEVAALEKDGRFGKMTGREIVDLISRGELDGGLIGEGSFIEAVHNGIPIVAAALLGHDRADAPDHGIVLRKGIVIGKPKDFSGLKLITRRAGPSDAVFLREFLRREGIPEKSVTITDQVENDLMKPMLKKGEADGAYMHLLAIDSLIRRGIVYVYRPMNWLNPEISLALLVFRRDFLQGHRDLVLKITAGYMKRIAHELAIPADQREKDKRGKGRKTALMELDFTGMNLPVYDYPPRVRLELLDEMQALMVTHGLLKGTTNLGNFVDPGIVEAAWQTQSPPRETE